MLQIGSLKLYDVRDLAELLQVHEKTVRKLLRTGDLKGKKLAKKWFVAENEIQTYFQDRG